MNKYSIAIFILLLTSINLFGQFSGGKGTSNNPYQISKIEDMIRLRDNVNNGNNYENMYFIMTNDIDFKGIKNWKPIGTDTSFAFNGSFDGSSYGVYNMNINGIYINTSESKYNNATSYAGLFGCIGNKGIISNLAIKTGSINIIKYANNYRKYVNVYAGTIAGANYGTIENCVNNIDISGIDSIIIEKIGGIAGINYGTIRDCCNSGNMTQKNTVYGIAVCAGIAGFAPCGSNIINCYNSGNIVGTDCTGGIAGNSGPYNEVMTISYIANCVNIGSLSKSMNTSYARIGGIIGWAEHCKIEDSYNTGEIDISGNFNTVGGIAGMLANSKNRIIHCYNAGSISGMGNHISFGGITGELTSYISAENGMEDWRNIISICYNQGDIIGNGDSLVCGGIVGYNSNTFNSNDELINCYNAGKILSEYMCGGIVGKVDSLAIFSESVDGYENLIIGNCYNIGDIVGEYAGGVIGWQDIDVKIDNSYYLESTAQAGIAGGNDINGTIMNKTYQNMQNMAFVDELNNGQTFKVWSQDIEPKRNNGFPILPPVKMPNGGRITASAMNGGSIFPNGNIGNPPCSAVPTTFTIIPDSCYRIIDVLVDGISIGAVSSYGYPAGKSGNIQAVFKEGSTVFHLSSTTYIGNKPAKNGYIHDIGNKVKIRTKLHSNIKENSFNDITTLKISFDYQNVFAYLQPKTLKLLDAFQNWTIVDAVHTENTSPLTSNYTVTLSNPSSLAFVDSVDIFDIEFLLTFPIREAVPNILLEYYTTNISPELTLSTINCLDIDLSKLAKINIQPVCADELRYISISDMHFSLNNVNNSINYSIAFDCKDAYLNIYNMLGESIIAPITNLKRGIYELDLNSLELTTGIYFCELNIDGVSRKIINFGYVE